MGEDPYLFSIIRDSLRKSAAKKDLRQKDMTKQTTTIPIASIILDESIYPRKGIDHRRVGMFAEHIRDGFTFDPIEVEQVPGKPGKYRLLDGAHRWSAYKSAGVTEIEAIITNLDGRDPLLYAAKKAIGPRQLTEDETRETARRAYNKTPASAPPISERPSGVQDEQWTHT